MQWKWQTEGMQQALCVCVCVCVRSPPEWVPMHTAKWKSEAPSQH